MLRSNYCEQKKKIINFVLVLSKYVIVFLRYLFICPYFFLSLKSHLCAIIFIAPHYNDIFYNAIGRIRLSKSFVYTFLFSINQNQNASIFLSFKYI